MRAPSACGPVALACLAVLGSRVAVWGGTEPPFVHRQSFIGENFFFALVPNSTHWVTLQASVGLSNWVDVASVATTNNATILHDPDAQNLPHRFYRLRTPGFSAEEAEAQWRRRATGNYRCRMEHWEGFRGYTCTLTVTHGQTSITDAQMDGQPLEQPDPRLFPSVDDLLAALREAQHSGCRRVAVIYDPDDHYPTWCVVERLGLAPWGYRISEFSFLSPASQSPQVFRPINDSAGDHLLVKVGNHQENLGTTNDTEGDPGRLGALPRCDGLEEP